MISQKLKAARDYEQKKETEIKEEERPSFHLSPRVGWMNDPNGFSWYQGQYHMFYQYHPYTPFWGPMHWGHAVSRDLLHWEYLPAVLAPDMDYDRDGCFSGSAMELPDGSHLLLYTGVKRKTQEDGSWEELQCQCIAVGDGINYKKLDQNPVLREEDIPEGGNPQEFRDPKMWKCADGTYRCIAANADRKRDGQILLYGSRDAIHWQFHKMLIKNQERFGTVWECPDFFSLDGKQVLIASPMDMLPKESEYFSGNSILCLIGTYAEETETFTEEVSHTLDYGVDHYASQTILTPDGRRVLIGWMQNWDTCTLHSPKEKWFGQLTLPRELSIRNQRLCQMPVRELESIRRNPVFFRNVHVSEEEISLDGICGRIIDLELEIRPEERAGLFKSFTLQFAVGDGCYTSVCFEPEASTLEFDRTYSGTRRAMVHCRKGKIQHNNGELKLRIILDQFSAEVFVNHGEYVFTMTLDTPQEAEGILFRADGQACINIQKFDLQES